jgi:hypothetical protein
LFAAATSSSQPFWASTGATPWCVPRCLTARGRRRDDGRGVIAAATTANPVSHAVSLRDVTRGRRPGAWPGSEDALRCVEWSIPIGHARNLPHLTTLVKVRCRSGYEGVSSETIW